MAKEYYWITPETGFTFKENFVVLDGLSSIQFRKGSAYPPNHEIYFKTIKAVKQLLKQVPNSRGLTYSLRSRRNTVGGHGNRCQGQQPAEVQSTSLGFC